MDLTLGVLTTSAATGTCAWEIITGATPGRARLMELGLFLTAATASSYGLGYPAAVGVNPTTPVDFLKTDPNDVLASGVVQSALAWGTGPTSPTAFFRRISLPATVGTGVIWTFGDGIVIPVSSSIVLWNLGNNSTVNAYAVIRI